jgi:hypothetical protein
MTSRQLSLRRGKTGDVQKFSASRLSAAADIRLLEETLGSGINNSRRHQILSDPNNVQQFACLWGESIGFLTRPVITTSASGDTVVLGNFTDTIGEPLPVTVPLAAFQGTFTTLVRRGDATAFNLAVHPTSPDTVGGPPRPLPGAGRRAAAPTEPTEATLERLNFALAGGENPTDEDHPVIAALPLFLPVGPSQTFPHPVALADPQTFRDTFPLLETWRQGMAYALTHNGGHSVTIGGPLFHLPALAVVDGVAEPFDAYEVRDRLLLEPTTLAPTHPLFQVGRTQFAAWSDAVWTELGANLEPEAPPVGAGGDHGFTPAHFRAAMEPLVNKDKTFGPADRTKAKYRLLLAGAPPPGSPTPDRVVLPDLRTDFEAYLSVSSSAVAGDDLKELVKSRLYLANASTICLDKDVTLEPENVTLAFSDRLRTCSWLVEKLVSTSVEGARSVLGLLQFLTPDREALALVAEGDNEAKTLLMSNSSNSTAQLDASKASKLYCSGRLSTFRHSYEAFCNLRCVFSAMVEDVASPLVIVKLLDYANLLVDRQGRLLFEAYRRAPYLAIHPWQDLQTILSGFLRIATTSSMYGAVTRGEHVSITNYQSAIDVADGLIADLRAIIHGSGLGKFEGTPNCASWFGSTPPSSGKNSGGGGHRDHDATDPPLKRLKSDPDEVDRKKALGVLVFDLSASNNGRLPGIDVYHKVKGAKTPERLCMKFLTRGFVCTKEGCKLPHVTNVGSLPAAARTKLVSVVAKHPALSWVEGKAPSGTK